MRTGHFLALMSSLGRPGLAARVALDLLTSGCSRQCARDIAAAPLAAVPALVALLSALISRPAQAAQGPQAATQEAAQAALAALAARCPALTEPWDQLLCLLAMSRVCTRLQAQLPAPASSPAAGRAPSADSSATTSQPEGPQKQAGLLSSAGAAAAGGSPDAGRLASYAFGLMTDLLLPFQPALIGVCWMVPGTNT